MANRPYVPKLMQLNNWVIIAAALLVLLIIARYMQHQEPPAICTESGRSEYRLADDAILRDRTQYDGRSEQYYAAQQRL
jgi:hypothetical protein